MDGLAKLREATDRLTEAEAAVSEARLARDNLIIQLALDTQLTYEQMAAATGLSISGIWKVTTRAGISRQRVRVA